MATKSIPKIVLTGGPCAGKTTILCWLQQKLADFGYAVVVVPEAATRMITSGLKSGANLLSASDFQSQLMAHTIETEDRFIKAASLIQSEKVIVIFDRGVMDARAYMSADAHTRILQSYGLHLTEARDGRYDAVIHLVSLAVHQPELYTCANNEAREETVEQARVLDELTQRAWVGHPHLRVVGGVSTLDGRFARVLSEACSVLGLPIPIEIERKYRLTPGCYHHESVVDTLSSVTVDITQHYLKADVLGTEERVRTRSQDGGTIYFHTTKWNLESGGRGEIERRITAAEYYHYLRRRDPEFAPIRKRRTCFLFQGQYFELDRFQCDYPWDLLEIELTAENQSVVLPDCLTHSCLEVTGDPSYSNREIARLLARRAKSG